MNSNKLIEDILDRFETNLMIYAGVEEINMAADDHDAIVSSATQAIKSLLLEACIDELENAVQQFIHITHENPHNFTDYAHHRLTTLNNELKELK